MDISPVANLYVNQILLANRFEYFPSALAFLDSFLNQGVHPSNCEYTYLTRTVQSFVQPS